MTTESKTVSMPFGTYDVTHADGSSEQMTYVTLMAVDPSEYEGAVARCVSQASDVVELRNGVWGPYEGEE